MNNYPTPVIIDVTQPSAPPPKPPKEPSKVVAFLRKYVLAPLPILIVAIVAVLLAMVGVKNVQVGGIIGKLLGKKPPEPGKSIEVANSVPAGRVREDGSLIKIGEPDSQGITQAKVVPIEKPGLFSDPKVIKVTPPGADKPIEVKVPDGVKAHDIEHVIVVQQEIKAVTIKNTSKVSAQEVDDLLKKYAGH